MFFPLFSVMKKYIGSLWPPSAALSGLVLLLTWGQGTVVTREENKAGLSEIVLIELTCFMKSHSHTWIDLL